MKFRHVIYGAGGLALFALLAACLAPRGSGDVSKVRIGFAGYGVVDGKRSLMLVITNGSSYRINIPDGNYDLDGESLDGWITGGMSVTSSSCCFGRPTWGWWQLQFPKIPNIAPGTTFRFSIPVEDGPYTWHLTIPLTTIPLRERLPYVLQSRWPKSKRDKPISFAVTALAIPPVPSSSAMPPKSSTTSLTDVSGREAYLTQCRGVAAEVRRRKSEN